MFPTQGLNPCLPNWQADSLPLSHLGSAAAAAKLLQPCPALCDPIDSSPPGSPVPGILQARTLEWVAIVFSWEALEACESTEKASEDTSSAAGLGEGPGLSSVSRGFSFHLLVSFFLQ